MPDAPVFAAKFTKICGHNIYEFLFPCFYLNFGKPFLGKSDLLLSILTLIYFIHRIPLDDSHGSAEYEN